MMKLTTHKWVCNVIAVPKPTEYTQNNKYKPKHKKTRLVRNLSERRDYIFSTFFCEIWELDAEELCEGRGERHGRDLRRQVNTGVAPLEKVSIARALLGCLGVLGQCPIRNSQ